jgi:lauroyl/myristoyl acyltransferase
MKLRSLIAAVMFAMAGSAFAMHCPMDMKKIDEALAKKPDISAEKLSEVKKLRAEGEKLHKAGNHQASVDTLAKAMAILGIQ